MVQRPSCLEFSVAVVAAVAVAGIAAHELILKTVLLFVIVVGGGVVMSVIWL